MECSVYWEAFVLVLFLEHLYIIHGEIWSRMRIFQGNSPILCNDFWGVVRLGVLCSRSKFSNNQLLGSGKTIFFFKVFFLCFCIFKTRRLDCKMSKAPNSCESLNHIRSWKFRHETERLEPQTRKLLFVKWMNDYKVYIRGNSGMLRYSYLAAAESDLEPV